MSNWCELDDPELVQMYTEATEKAKGMKFTLAPKLTPEAEKAMATTIKYNIGRNDPCPCGSGLKFKKCCLRTLNK